MCYLVFKADLKAKKQAHLLERNYQCKLLCERCDAVQPKTSEPQRLTYKNMAVDAPYLNTLVTHEHYLATTLKPSPWTPMGWRIDNTPHDWMHVVYLGTAPGHIASCLKLLQLLGYGYKEGESTELYLRRASIEMRKECAALGRFVCMHTFHPPLARKRMSSHDGLRSVHRLLENGCLIMTAFSRFASRLYLPRRILSSKHCFPQGEYAELSSKYKAAHVKQMLWWIARKTAELRKQNVSWNC